jgi:hypothetical protein
VQVLGFRRCTRSLEGTSAGWNLAGDGDDAAGRGVAGGREEEILGFRVSGGGEGRNCRHLRFQRRRMEELATGEGSWWPERQELAAAVEKKKTTEMG